MMNVDFFTYLCVSIVITFIVLAVTAVIDSIIDKEASDLNRLIVGWIVSSIGFGTCLTFILYQNGIL